ncbi:hypothetical protein [Leeuwenhoekiella sp. MAR_2009_132]|uniref:hypothetical protein n=1 Tax=Leeuwenhoekiella sp. MAR_2009_132 TaxID=1392489 RepID=UPI00048E66E0|nr:hypothetical protein [Leeuwenhoekiella sp. MAR_2009_132]
MKKIITILSLAVLFISCSSDDSEIPNRDVTVLNSSTFVSEQYVNSDNEIRLNAIKFLADGKITYFKSDEFYNKIELSEIDFGRYDLNYPKISNIANVNIFSEEEITIEKDSEGLMFFVAGGLRYEYEIINFK